MCRHTSVCGKGEVFLCPSEAEYIENTKKVVLLLALQPFFLISFSWKSLYTQRLDFLAVVWIWLAPGWGLGQMLWCWKWEVRSQGVHASFHNLWFPLQPCVTCIPWEHSSSSQGTRPQSWNPENGKEMCKKPCVFAAVGLGRAFSSLVQRQWFW